MLENVDEKINIYLIFDDSNYESTLPENITSHKNLGDLEVKKFNTKRNFFNVTFAHVSNATFYRLYLDEFFEGKKDVFVYLDADIICINNPLPQLKLTINNMKKEGFNFAFADELYRFQYEEPFSRLSMVNEKYFNAGVMLVNLDYWINENLTSKSLSLIDDLKEKAKFWDQDILNSLLDGNYLSLNNNLNFRTGGDFKERKKDEIIFIHYSGKSKPWDVGGIFEDLAIDYHHFYKKLTGKNFHIVVKNRKNAIKKLIKIFKSHPEIRSSSLLIYFLKSIFSVIKK